MNGKKNFIIIEAVGINISYCFFIFVLTYEKSGAA